MRFILIFLLAFAIQAASNDLLEIPATRLSLTIEHQAVAITTSGTIRRLNPAEDLYAVAITADLSDFQQNLTALLKPQLDREDKCGDHVNLQNAAIVPSAGVPSAGVPSAGANGGSSLATVQLRYERWGCVKALGY